MSRPRRSLPIKSYTMPSSEEESDAEVRGSGFDSLSDDSTLTDASDEEFSDAKGSDASITGNSADNSATLSLFPAALTGSQINQTRAVVTEQAAEVAELQAKYEQYTKLAEEFKTKLNDTRHELEENRAKIAPVRRIPPEILGVIFVAHVRDNQESPWLLMQVSRAWRATSLLTRGIWRGIMLAPAAWRGRQGRHLTRTFKGLEVCKNEVQLQNALARAGSLPLDLRVTTLRYPPPRYNNMPSSSINTQMIARDKSELCELLKLLQNRLKVSRLRSLDIDTADQITFAMDQFDGFSFVDMESLTLDFNYSRILSKVAKESTLVHTLNVPSTGLRNLKDFRWRGLDQLALAPVSGGARINIKQILVTTKFLTALKFEGDAVGSAEPDQMKVEMFSLKNLSMMPTGAFWPIECPNLTHLTLKCPRAEVLPDQSILLPCLFELTFIAGNTSMEFLRAFQLPSLHKLSLRHLNSKAISAKGTKKLWPIQAGSAASKRSPPSDVEPTSLHLRLFPINQTLLARTLNERVSLEELTTEDSLINAEFFSALTPVRIAKGKGSKGNGKGATKGKKSLGSKRGWSVGCPELKRIVVDLNFRTFKPEQKAEILKSAKNLVAQRLEVDAPLERLSILFRGYEGLHELV